MKRHLLAILLLLLCSASNFAFAGSDSALLAINSPWDFGQITQGEKKEHTFRMKNKGIDTLEIKSINACCGYSVSAVSSWEIDPQKESKITIICDTSKKNLGKNIKYLTITSTDPNTPQDKIGMLVDVIAKDTNDSKLPKTSSPAVTPIISAQELYENIKASNEDTTGSVCILDVREKSEFTEKHIENSINIPRTKMGDDLQSFLDSTLKGKNKKNTFVVCCGSGSRSSYIAGKLVQLGFNAFNLSGGISAWSKSDLPLIKGPKTESKNEFLTISSEEAYEHYFLIFGDKTLWLDVREPEDFNKSHIRGASNIPYHSLAKNLGSVPKDKNIVIYCESKDCEASKIAGALLLDHGYKQGKVRVFIDGFFEWEQCGYPIDSKDYNIL